MSPSARFWSLLTTSVSKVSCTGSDFTGWIEAPGAFKRTAKERMPYVPISRCNWSP